MRLKVSKTINKRIVTVDLETTDFSIEENKMLDILGEPVIKFDKTYGDFMISIDKRIRTGFKVRVKFDGTDDIVAADEAADLMIQEDLPMALSEAMEKLRDIYLNIGGVNENKPPVYIDIKY